MQSPEAVGIKEQPDELVALRLKANTKDDIYAFADHVFDNKIAFSPHFESASYLFRRSNAQTLAQMFEVEDVTDIYNKLTSKTEGFRVVRVGYPKTITLGDLSYQNKAAIIKDYSSGDLYVFDETGDYQTVIPKIDEPVAYSPSRFQTVIDEPLQFFDSLAEALESGK